MLVLRPREALNSVRPASDTDRWIALNRYWASLPYLTKQRRPERNVRRIRTRNRARIALGVSRMAAEGGFDSGECLLFAGVEAGLVFDRRNLVGEFFGLACLAAQQRKPRLRNVKIGWEAG